jgi:hypothetical protein
VNPIISIRLGARNVDPDTPPVIARKPTEPRTWHLAVGAILWVGLFFLFVYNLTWVPYSSIPEEDAFISFRFAENIIQGLGPVFNRSGPPVEGYTNFLWTVGLVVGHKIV